MAPQIQKKSSDKTKMPRILERDLESIFEKHGLQPTLQRMAIGKYVLCQADHPTAEDIHSWVQAHVGRMSQATVYNTLNTLVDAGLLREFKFQHMDKSVYDWNTHDHFHFIDEKTGEIYDIEASDVKIQIDLPKKFKISSMKLIIKGIVK